MSLSALHRKRAASSSNHSNQPTLGSWKVKKQAKTAPPQEFRSKEDLSAETFTENHAALIFSRRVTFMRLCTLSLEKGDVSSVAAMCKREIQHDPFSVAQVLFACCSLEGVTDRHLLRLLPLCPSLLQVDLTHNYIPQTCINSAAGFVLHCLDVCSPLITSCATPLDRKKHARIVENLNKMKPILTRLSSLLDANDPVQKEVTRKFEELLKRMRLWN